MDQGLPLFLKKKTNNTHTVSSARESSHASTSFNNSWSWSSGDSAEIAILCNKSTSLFSSTVSGRSTWSLLALDGSNLLRQRGQIRGLNANRHLHHNVSFFLLGVHLGMKTTTYARAAENVSTGDSVWRLSYRLERIRVHAYIATAGGM